MSKLPKERQFVDLSDYGRPIARVIAQTFHDKTNLTAVHVTWLFVLSGLIAVFFILEGKMWFAAIFLILKSILDAADGELARISKRPSYIGRYLDSVADISLNFLIIYIIFTLTNWNIWFALAAFISMQLQGTLFNYYYVILRNQFGGDKTSRIQEDSAPKALFGENQKVVNFLYYLFRLLYGPFDKAIYLMDRSAPDNRYFPHWFMTTLSILGLGFQLLMISILLVIGKIEWIIPFFIIMNILMLALIIIRKYFIHIDSR